jgi:hypothetical protein
MIVEQKTCFIMWCKNFNVNICLQKWDMPHCTHNYQTKWSSIFLGKLTINSAMQEIFHPLRILSIYNCIHKVTPPLVPILKPCVIFYGILYFYCKELLTTCPSPKLDDHPLWAVQYCLFSMFTCILHLQPEVTPCHGDKGSTQHGHCT